MPRFNYLALDARGQEASGLLEAASSSAAISQLRQAGYFPTSVIEEAISSPDGKEARRRTATVARVTKPRAKKGIVLFERKKVKSKILMIFTRQLATLIDSGLPLLPKRFSEPGTRQSIEKNHQQTRRFRTGRQHVFRRAGTASADL
jgi:type IV pilus assembly protein PilC